MKWDRNEQAKEERQRRERVETLGRELSQAVGTPRYGEVVAELGSLQAPRVRAKAGDTGQNFTCSLCKKDKSGKNFVNIPIVQTVVVKENESPIVTDYDRNNPPFFLLCLGCAKALEVIGV